MVHYNIYCVIFVSFLFQITLTIEAIIANAYYSPITGKYTTKQKDGTSFKFLPIKAQIISITTMLNPTRWDILKEG